MLKMIGNGPNVRVRVAPRPRQQHVERVGEHNLAGDEDGRVPDRIPIEAPIDVNRELRDRLHVVLGAQHDLGRERPPAGANREHREPDQEDGAGPFKGAQQQRIRSDVRMKSEGRQRDDERQRHQQPAKGRATIGRGRRSPSVRRPRLAGRPCHLRILHSPGSYRPAPRLERKRRAVPHAATRNFTRSVEGIASGIDERSVQYL